MIYKRVVLKAEAVQTVRREMRKAKVTETGGALVGYIEDEKLVVTAASGPGPRARLSLREVWIDGEYAGKFCDRAYSQTGGKWDYVGDWHCHLGCSLKPSSTDRYAMKKMAGFEYCPTRNPLSLIFCKWSHRIKAYRFDGGLVLVPHVSETPRRRSKDNQAVKRVRFGM